MRLPFLRLLGFVTVWLLGSLPALAQSAAEIGPAAKRSDRWLAVVVAAVLIIGVGVAAFMGSRRSHLD